MGDGAVVSRPPAGHARRAAYVVLSHRYTDQVSRLVDATIRLSPSSGVLVYHDARGCAPPVLDHPNVRVVAHHSAADWGSWELVESTIAAMGIAVRTFDPDLLVLVSQRGTQERALLLDEVAPCAIHVACLEGLPSVRGRIVAAAAALG